MMTTKKKLMIPALLAAFVTLAGCTPSARCIICRVPPSTGVDVCDPNAGAIAAMPAAAPAAAPDPCHDRVRLYGVNFDFDQATLRGDDQDVLDALVNSLHSCPATNVRIEGHTDSLGSDAYNQNLSERRAAAVVDFLVASGLNPDTLQSIGLGESSPVADNAVEEGRALNRRVEVAPAN